MAATAGPAWRRASAAAAASPSTRCCSDRGSSPLPLCLLLPGAACCLAGLPAGAKTSAAAASSASAASAANAPSSAHTSTSLSDVLGWLDRAAVLALAWLPVLPPLVLRSSSARDVARSSAAAAAGLAGVAAAAGLAPSCSGVKGPSAACAQAAAAPPLLPLRASPLLRAWPEGGR